MDDELEPEILSYREFRNRETLRAWEQRRRAIESRPNRWRDSLSRDGDLPQDGAQNRAAMHLRNILRNLPRH